MIALLAAVALVVDESAPLRAQPRDGAALQARLVRGEWLEVRGQAPGWLQVYDHPRERPGYVREEAVQVFRGTPDDGQELRAVLRFLRGARGFEALGIGVAALLLRADAAQPVEVYAAVGELAERFARRLDRGEPAAVAQRGAVEAYGVRFLSIERGAAVRACYEGDAYRRVLAADQAGADERAKAALALTEPACSPPAEAALELAADEWRLSVLDRATGGAGRVGAQLRLRRAGVLARLAWRTARGDEPGKAAALAQRALEDLAGVERGALADEDAPARAEATLLVAASRWAALPEVPARGPLPALRTSPGRPGETCLALLEAGEERLRRCTYGHVWTASVRASPEGLAVAVQPTPSWAELWVFRRHPGSRAWSLAVLPPSAGGPGTGYVEAAGFTPGARRLLTVREWMDGGRLHRRFEVRRLRDLRLLGSAGASEALSAFSRSSSPSWRDQTLALR